MNARILLLSYNLPTAGVVAPLLAAATPLAIPEGAKLAQQPYTRIEIPEVEDDICG